ncbi:MAG: VOC family protein [Firmicutes bacterium]|nr:VOC family protein [Bacillota bacterium]
MQLELFLNFDGNCREAGEFYAKVFQSEVKNLMTYGDTPPNSDFSVAEADRDKIMYADVMIGGVCVMLMDMPSDSPLFVGNNVSPTLSTESADETARIFNGLKEGGEVYMELQKTFFSECYGMVRDKFGVVWQILQYAR